jgi:hypothetical protein
LRACEFRGAYGGRLRPKSVSFDDFLASIIDSLGYAWTWGDVENLDWPRWRALERRIRVHPPVHWLVAAFVGFKPQEPEPRDADFAAARAETAKWFRAPARFFKR